ncbi:MAG TPA: hypothetical protein GX404_04165 [Syntrophomonadaceae bacterium]|nr:hypothetical protein [Syntrophomonadaceae bacterium]
MAEILSSCLCIEMAVYEVGEEPGRIPEKAVERIKLRAIHFNFILRILIP